MLTRLWFYTTANNFLEGGKFKDDREWRLDLLLVGITRPFIQEGVTISSLEVVVAEKLFARFASNSRLNCRTFEGRVSVEQTLFDGLQLSRSIARNVHVGYNIIHGYSER